MKLLVAGGGTGGHLFPGLSVAKRFVQKFPGSQALFVGSGKPIDRKLVTENGFEFVSVPQVPPARSVFSFQMLKFGLNSISSFVKAVGVARRLRPDVVLGLGGFSSVPPVLAARLFKVPAVLFEPNLYPGKANLFLSWFVSTVAVGFGVDSKHFSRNQVVVTGIPVREPILAAAKQLGREKRSGQKSSWTLLVMGGSKGAQAINTVVADAFPRMKEKIPGLKLIHLTGELDYPAVEKHYRNRGGNGDVEVHPFLMEMEKAFSRADAVVARCGASSLAEFAVCGLPSVLVPYPYSTDDHQVRNAEYFQEQSAAKMILEKQLTPEILVNAVEELALQPQKCSQMKAAARQLASEDATEKLVDLLASCAAKGN